MLGRFARLVATSALLALATGCGSRSLVAADGLPLRRVVVYRNGVAYFERSGHVEEDQVRFRVKETEVGDFLATLAVLEKGGSTVRSAAFPLKTEEDEANAPAKPADKRDDKHVVLALDGKAHDLEVGYVVEAPVWRPSYRVVVEDGGQAYLQAWGIVQNLSGEDWKGVKLSLVAGAPLAFEARLGEPVVPERPVVTDEGEVIAAVPRGDTSLDQTGMNEAAAAPEAPADEPSTDDAEMEEERDARADKKAPSAKATAGLGAMGSGRGGGGKVGAARSRARSEARPVMPPPPPPPPTTAPRSLRSLAAVAVEAGTTRYDLPEPVTVPDKSATMVMILSKKVPGEALFLFAPDGGVPDSSSHPFRVARFTNKTAGTLERGPIAVYEKGSFLGQGMLDPLPAGATATVPFALERALAVDSEVRYDELGERVAKIENGELTIERDSVRLTKYRLRNGGDEKAKILVRHPRQGGTRLEKPPAGTEDNVGTQTALVPATLAPRSTAELLVDERSTLRRHEDWFSVVADHAVKAYVADPRADRAVASALQKAWAVRAEIERGQDVRKKLEIEQSNLSRQSQETRQNLRAIEKNKAAAELRAKLTARLADTSARLDEITKRLVETDAKLAEQRIAFKELVRDLRVDAPLPPR